MVQYVYERAARPFLVCACLAAVFALSAGAGLLQAADKTPASPQSDQSDQSDQADQVDQARAATTEESAPQADEEAAQPAPAAFHGIKVSIDPATGRIVPPTPEQARALSARLQGMVNRSTQGLQARNLPNGAVAVDLEGRFMSLAIARVQGDGSVKTECTDDLAEAEALYRGEGLGHDESEKEASDVR